MLKVLCQQFVKSLQPWPLVYDGLRMLVPLMDGLLQQALDILRPLLLGVILTTIFEMFC